MSVIKTGKRIKLITVKRFTSANLNEAYPLFDAYRVFYKQPSNPEAAKNFLAHRLSNNESVIFLAFSNEKAVGFTQLYPTFSSVSLERMFVLNDLFVLPDYRKNGVASLLLNKQRNFAKLKTLKV